MLFLGMDTSTSVGSIALCEPGKILAESLVHVRRTHIERLLPAIDRLFADAGAGLSEVGALAVTVGPGSFTGLRIGLATAKVLALATGKPLVGLPTLDVLAASAVRTPGLICAILDARRGEMYVAFYRQDRNGDPRRLSDYLALSPRDLVSRIREPVLLIGDGLPVYGERLRAECKQEVTLAPPECNVPRSSVLCRLAMEQYAREGGTHPRDLQALYVRASDAELNRKQGGR